MAYDHETAERLRKTLKRRKGITERKMFGGIAFMLDGNMVCGVLDKDLVLRLGNDEANKARQEPWVRAMDFTGRPMRSMVYVAPEGFMDDDSLKEWINRALKFARTLPPK